MNLNVTDSHEQKIVLFMSLHIHYFLLYVYNLTENYICHLFCFTDTSQHGRYEETSLQVTCEWPYVTVQWKWHLGDYEMVIISN
jgi:hypothetical protein